ncbi:hypothetical protein JTE90_011637 [Oedothorax gibbosus]|uniref:Uncharacterized protein n=1 Tax=Oedothorax gibbosus TaxID=931172 RepID=A0AAV6TFE2_9ARAC|nr:hypothetical protein JTE90_011637 [Oedothorax gibbosus]
MVASHHGLSPKAHAKCPNLRFLSKLRQDYYRNDEGTAPAKKTHPEPVLGADRALQGGSAFGAKSVILTGRFPLNRRVFTLENLLRIWVRTAKITLSPSDFQGQQRRTGHRKRPVLLREQRPISGRADSGTELLQRKDNSSPGPPVDVSSSVAFRTLVPKDLSPCPVGEY